MPVKNALPYLQTCLDSILDQTYKNWELIAINDHSEDKSFEVLKEYASKHPSIHPYQNKGAGIIDALKTAYSYTKGEYITRMDADDIMPPIKLDTLRTLLLDQKGKSLSTGHVKYISENHLGDGYKKYEKWLNSLCTNNNHYADIYRECVIPSPCWMMHRADFESIGGFDCEDYPEDYDLCFRMYENQIKVLPSTEVLHIWRDHGKRASRNDDNYSDNRFLDMKVKYFIRNDYKSDEKLILWGAGKKGKWIAKFLLKNNIDFDWITNNPNKIGKHIYDKLLVNQDVIINIEPKSLIIAVANEEEQSEIIKTVSTFSKKHLIYKFC